MRNFAYFILSTILILVCADLATAQRRIVDSELKDRMRDKQRAYEDPANNPFKIDNSPPLKKPETAVPPGSPLRAIVELQVVGIMDGDTLVISNTANQHLRIRIQGIDAPEAGQSYSLTAKENLAQLLKDKLVTVEFDPRGKPDGEGRIVAKVYLEGYDVGLEQLKAGLAWYCKEYKKELSESDRYTYAEAEKTARGSRLGLWRESSPQTPWEFRRKQ
jgi:endonuclease YncB( thermonuclease family)